MDLVVGLTCFDRFDRFQKCVRSLSRASGTFRTIIFDDASLEISHAFTRDHLPKAEIYKARSPSGRADFAIFKLMKILVERGGEFNMLLDSDMVVDPHFFEWLGNNVERSDGVISLFNTASHPTLADFGELLQKRSIGSAGAVFRRDILQRIVSEVPPSGRYDWDWSKFLNDELGVRILVSKRSFVQHLGLTTGQNSGVFLGDWGDGFVGFDRDNLSSILDELDRVNRFILSRIK